MSKVVLISRRQNPFVGWVCIDEFEDLFAELCGATIVAPHLRPRLPRALSRVRDRVLSDVSIGAKAPALPSAFTGIRKSRPLENVFT